jgi:hypothetical protein
MNTAGQAYGLSVTWSDLEAEYKKLQTESGYSLFCVMCDILHLNTNIMVQEGLFNFARQIVVGANAQISITNAGSSVTLAFDDIVDDSGVPQTLPIASVVDPHSLTLKSAAAVEGTVVTLATFTAPSTLQLVSLTGSFDAQTTVSQFLGTGQLLYLDLTAIFRFR